MKDPVSTNITFPYLLWKRAKRAALELDLSLNALIRVAVLDYLKAPPIRKVPDWKRGRPLSAVDVVDSELRRRKQQ